MNHTTNNIKNLEQLDRNGLVKQWCDILGASPPKASSRVFLLRSVAYEIQAKHNIGLNKSDLKVLASALSQKKSICASPNVKSPNTNPRIKLVPGSRLVREWNGNIYTVSVIEEGFVYKDKVWASLSAIARDITSAHWSGPRFFGVNGAVQ